MSFIPHVITSKNVTVFLDGEPIIVSVGTPQYDYVIKAIEAGDVNALKDAVQIRQAIVKLSHGKIELDGSVLKYDGQPLHGALVDRILRIVKGAGNAAPLLTFLDNLMQNPSHRAVTELYGFLEACDLPITVDGCFLAYKRVRHDYKSIHDGKTDNSIGAKPSMPRNMVNEDKDQTCSTGLHFCSESYLPHFSSSGNDRVVIVKVNPRDVVSIPSDYNNAKGRACAYEIVGELDTYGRELIEKLSAHFDDTFVKPDKAPLVKDDDDTWDSGWDVDDEDDDDSLVSGWDVDDEDDDFDFTSQKAPIGVAAKQTKVGQSTLSDQTVRDIRQHLNEGWPLATIARTYGTSARTVARIRDGETYTHVK